MRRIRAPCGMRVSAGDPPHDEEETSILAADELNLRELRRRCPPDQHHRLALFLGDVALPDPYYGESDDFEKVLDLVEKQAFRLVSAWTRATE